MKKKEFIIIHGLNGSPKGHWQDYLYNDLKALGETVFFPRFPNNGHPELNAWLKYLYQFRDHIHENSVIIAHSMGVILWLHYLEKNHNIKVKNTVLVAPPSNDFLKEHSNTRSFADFSLNPSKFNNSSKERTLIATENDSYCLETAKKAFAEKVPVNYIELPPQAGHINIDSGYGSWKFILQLALGS